MKHQRKQTLSGKRPHWTEHFSEIASDLILVHYTFSGPEMAQEIVLRCFKKSKSDRINIHTVCQVLSEMEKENESWQKLK